MDRVDAKGNVQQVGESILVAQTRVTSIWRMIFVLVFHDAFSRIEEEGGGADCCSQVRGATKNKQY